MDTWPDLENHYRPWLISTSIIQQLIAAYEPISDYAAIGDLRSLALTSKVGSIDG